MSTEKQTDSGFDLIVEGGTIHVSPGPSVGDNASISLAFTAEAPPVEVPPPDLGPPAMEGDGSDAAPTGAPQEPGLLDGYMSVPAWKVAGVHYRVGPNLPPVMKPVPVEGLIEINGSTVTLVGDGTVLSNFDLTGMNIVVNGNGCRITDCLLKVGGSGSWYLAQVYGDRCVIDYCELDGRGNTTNQSALVAVYGRDPVFRYNDAHDFAQHVLEMVQGNGAETTLDYRFNLIRRGGQGQGAHLNILQWNTGLVTEALVMHNTMYQQKGAAAGEAVQFYGNAAGWNCESAAVSRNVFISEGGDLANNDPAVSYFLNITAGIGDAEENHFDLRSAYGWLYPGTRWTLNGNIDMVGGETLEP